MIEQILNAIDEEISKLRQARALLAESGPATAGRKAAKAPSAPASGTKPRRKLSAKARHAISEAQRKRWAKVKSQKKAAAPTAAERKEPATS